jgi:hypothetical protein
MDEGPSLVSLDFLERQPTVCENEVVKKLAASNDLYGMEGRYMEWNVHGME